MSWIVLVGVALAMQAMGATPATSETDTPAMAAARVNKSLVKVQPEFKSGPDAEFPATELAAGAHGKVVISGIMGLDGRLSETKIAQSSRSSKLDASAQAAALASVFEPARDAQGKALMIPIQMPFEFYNAKSRGPAGGVLQYQCGQFARDYDWWRATWPAEKHDDFYLLVLGYSTLAKARKRDGSIDMTAFGKVNGDFEARWKAAVEICRKAPDRLMIDVFKPEGDMIRALAAR